ncbi:MAG: PIG-L deacetylase family protein [Acidimicrobiia bacterium]
MFEEFERVLVVGAHPDDIDFGAAGTVACLTDASVYVAYCLVTDGDAGGFDPAVPREDIPAIRRAEQTAAAAFVGVNDLHFLGYPDGRVEVTLELRRDLSRVIRQTRPDLVICQSPERYLDRIYASHPDHLATGEATLCAVYPDARNPYAHPELLAEGWDAHRVREVWLTAHPDSDHYVDVTDAVDRKLSALHAHESQHADPAAMDARVREWMTHTAEQAGLEHGRCAEAFRRIDTA